MPERIIHFRFSMFDAASVCGKPVRKFDWTANQGRATCPECREYRKPSGLETNHG